MGNYTKQQQQAQIKRQYDAELNQKLLETAIERNIDLIHLSQKLEALITNVLTKFVLEESIVDGKKYYRILKPNPKKL
jgi:hypothetical protein